jgi:hypothetical protein
LEPIVYRSSVSLTISVLVKLRPRRLEEDVPGGKTNDDPNFETKKLLQPRPLLNCRPPATVLEHQTRAYHYLTMHRFLPAPSLAV